jgi:hypothetical protein
MAQSEDLSSAPPPASSPSDGNGLHAAPQPPPAAKTQVGAWADELSSYVIDGVAWLRAMTTVRALTALRALVYGIVVIVALVAALLFITISLVRIWDVYVPIEPLGRRIWLGYVVFGGLYFIAGLFLVTWKRSGGPEE